MVEPILAFLELILLLGASAGLGSVFSRSHTEHDSLANPVIRITLGLGIISYLTLLFSACHMLGPWFFWAIALTGNTLLIKGRKKPLGPLVGIKPSPLAAALLVFLAFNLFFSLFPPTFYDSLLYHLAIPQYYIQHGGIIPWNCNFNSNLPLNGEMLYLFTLLGGTVYIPKLISLISGVAIILLMFQWYKKRFPATYPLLPALLFYATPQIGFLTSSSKTDMLGMLFLFSGLYTLFSYWERPEAKGNLILTGVFWGMAVGTKYIFAFFVVAFMVNILGHRGPDLKKKVTACLVISVMVLICLTPWFIKNTLIAHNPVYPYLNSIFKSPYWSTEQSGNFSSALKRNSNATGLELLYFPVELFLKPYKYGMTAVWGILFLVMSPFLLLSWKNRTLRYLILSSLMAFVALLFFARVPRYFLASLLLLSFPVARGMELFIKKKPGIKKTLIVIVLATMSVQLILQVDLQEKFFKGFQFLKGKITGKFHDISYLNIIPYYPAAAFINRELPSGCRIMLLGEDRSFYIKKDFAACSFADRHPIIESLKKDSDFSAILADLKKRSFTHILYSEKGLERLSRLSRTYRLNRRQKELLIRNLQKLEPVYQDQWCKLLKIEGTGY